MRNGGHDLADITSPHEQPSGAPLPHPCGLPAGEKLNAAISPQPVQCLQPRVALLISCVVASSRRRRSNPDLFLDSGLLRCARNDGDPIFVFPPALQHDTTSPSRGAMRPRDAAVMTLLKNKRAQGRPGARRSHGPRAIKMHGAGTTGSAKTSRPSPRDGLNAYTCSPRGPALLPPSPARSSHHRLGISTGMPGPHDFASAIMSARPAPCPQPPLPALHVS
jgi:hypothetical protein